MKNFDIKRIMEKLSSERKVFHSEADFRPENRENLVPQLPVAVRST